MAQKSNGIWAFVLTLAMTFAFILTAATPCYAQKIKVRKVKGNQAVIDFSGTTLVPGQTYELQDEYGTSKLSDVKPRRYFFDLSAGFSSHKADFSGSNSVTRIDLTAALGWNYVTFEIGPALSFSSASSGGVNSNTFLGGGYADWNILPNADGEVFTYGLSILALAGQTSVAENDLSTFRLQPGVFTKWFVQGSNTGFRINLAYQYDKYQGSGNIPSGSSSGVMGSVGIMTYF